MTVQNEIGEDIATESTYIVVQNSNDLFPYEEPFSLDENLETYEFVSDPLSGGINWSIESEVGHNDNGCIWIENGNLDEPFESELISRQFDLSSLEVGYISFWYAYAQKHPETDDRLRFYTSNSCGETWVQREMFRGESDLNTAGAPVLGEFVPSGNSQWLLYSYELSESDLNENFSFKFRFSNDNGNHVYIDDINLSAIDLNVTSNESTSQFSIYPNPAREEVIIKSELVKSGAELTLVNNLGQVISEIRETLPQGTSVLKMDVSTLEVGIYFIQIRDQKGSIEGIKKLVIH